MSRAAIATGCVLACASAPVAETGSNQQVTFRGRTDLVSVNVSVKQGNKPVSNLTALDFALTDNGVAQTVTALALEPVPIDLTLVMTGFQSTIREDPDAYVRTLTNASSVRQSLQPQDRLRTVSVQEEIRGGLAAREQSLWPQAVATSRYLGHSIVDGLFYAMAWPVDPDRRHLVVAFTDGFDRFSVLEMETLPDLAAHTDAIMHVVFWANPAAVSETLRLHWEADRKIVSAAARRTGGAVHTATDPSKDLAAILEDFRMSYVLQYSPQGVPTPGWHELRVRVTRPGRYDVRARQGYEVQRD